MITVIDYNAGNLKSVQNALKKIGAKCLVTQNPKDIIKAKKIIFPGVGAAAEAMKNLNELNIIKPIKEYIQSNKPFLGICLGAQILLEFSEENNGTTCMNIIKGSVKKFEDDNLVVPHMGWNQVDSDENNSLFRGIKNNSFFYFVHSYYLKPEQNNDIIGRTIYGQNFVSAMQKNNVYAVQFHPEKSADNGLKVLDNFNKLIN